MNPRVTVSQQTSDGELAPRAGTDLLLFFGGAFGLSWLLWGSALLAGGWLERTGPFALYVVGTFGPTGGR